MKDINENIDSPLTLKVSFNTVLKEYDTLVKSGDSFEASHAKKVLEIAEKNPVLREGFSDPELLNTYKEEIAFILRDTFNPILTNNEIKTASVPFHNLIFNASNRFKSIMKNAGKDYDLGIINMHDNDRYIIACTLILNFCYGYKLNLKRPFYYEIPDENGILRYYKILYNADFTEIIAHEDAPEITIDDYNELLDNFENIAIWKEKFPPNSYTFKGFVISNIFDVTDDQSISNIKSSLIGQHKRKDEGFMKDFHEIFQSLFGLKDIHVGFSTHNKSNDTFERVHGKGMTSYLLDNLDSVSCEDALCEWSYKRLLVDKNYFSVSDVDAAYKKSHGDAPHIKALFDQKIKSAIFAPIANNDGLLGVLEIVSHKPKILNSIIANKLVDVMPFIVSAVERSKNDQDNLIKAVIQKECTSIHESVYWRFEKEAKLFIMNKNRGKEAIFRKIAFEKVYPLYGQIDVQGSSDARNKATKDDLTMQLELAKSILLKANKVESLPIYDQFTFQLNQFINDLNENFQVDSEQKIIAFFKQDIEPLLSHLNAYDALQDMISEYYDHLDNQASEIYYHRKDFDETILKINKTMAKILDEKQLEAQAMYPHYFERFKTDGVEHNMYIGESITKDVSFNPIYLYNLRLWQMQVMCEMENMHYQMRENLPISLDVASLILVFNQPLSISFRMDEKQFDVDGTYNARYEIVKKRLDKAFIKGTKKRITHKGKLTIVYSQKQDEIEYLRYVEFLQSKKMLDQDVEIFEIEDLQAVTGLKALRVSVLYNKDSDSKSLFTYNDLIQEINA